jgi:menaquinone-dependent protoporphyrinogen oxidase
MARSILVAYATKHGSTREVAEALADHLRAEGLEVEVQPAREVADLKPFDGVVLGGALYFGRWHKDAVRFLERHADALETVPVAIFAMGPRTTEAKDLAESRAQLDGALSPDLIPATVAIFGGVIDPSKLSFPLNHLPASDARDWNAIRAWAHEAATRLARRERAGAVTP